jgi:fumarylacetoacetase
MTGLLRSWVNSANAPDSDFPLNNLPCGVFSAKGGAKRCCTAIGDLILDLQGLEKAGLLSFAGTLRTGSWNAFMALGRAEWARLRVDLTSLLKEGARQADAVAGYLLPMTEARLHMPFTVSEYTDFYASRHHAFNVGTMFRGPENALPPNWLHIPIGYNGRASSVVVSGTPVRRPSGQLKGPQDDVPYFGRSQRFDIELEMGAIVGQPSDGPISVAQAFENSRLGNTSHSAPSSPRRPLPPSVPGSSWLRRSSPSASPHRRAKCRCCPISPNPGRCSTTSISKWDWRRRAVSKR